MNKILNCIANKAICAAFVVLGAMSVCAAGTRVNLTDGNGNVIGYKVYGLGDNKNETAVVFTKAGAEIPWTVPAYLENVQFLVVAGGGGGGGAANNGLSAGAGGGGGGVVTGVIKSLAKGQKLAVMVGEGGEGGLFTESNEDKAGASISAGKKSYFKLNTIQDVTAYGGGRDLGVHQYGSTGGSRGGNRYDGLQGSGANQGVISNKTDIVSFTLYGNLGGNSDSNTYCFGAGGGGGATGQGGGRTQKKDYPNADLKGGHGGAGLTSDITGDAIVYGSGGGGGTTGSDYVNLDTGKAGVGAGDGAIAYKENKSLTVIRSYEDNLTAGNGGNGAPNQGGGGGGGAYGNGGNGGSGIVVFRYVDSSVACIGETGYETLDAAIAAAGAEDEIVVVADVATDAAFEITKKVAINLNGKTIATTEKDTEGNGVFWVKSGGELTVNGEGTVNGVGGNAYNIAIWADGGKVIINGGTYTNEGAQDSGPDGAHFDLIYAKNGGSVEINGGTFKCQTPNWTLNSHDTAKGTILVKGGTFYGFNPANCTTEGANTNFCADGLCGYVVETVDGVDFYGVTAAVAQIGKVKFASLDAAIVAAGADDEVVVVADIATDAAFVITKKVTIDLNGKTIATTEKDTEGNGVFWVKSGGELTLNGEGTVNGVGGNAYNIAIWADGGKVTINGGTYTNVGAQDSGPDGAHFDLIYAKNGGSVEINGGTFKCQTPNWTLNSHDTAKGTIVVKGGKFYQFNPSDCTTEGAGTNFCAANYRVEADGDWYVVKEGYTVTVEKPVVTVQTEEAANAVTLNVVAPDGLTADEKAAYLGYFEKKITPEGSGFKVELALVDAVKPVIAETTPAITFDDDGKVTVNIENKLPGLNYGVRYATTVEAVESAKIVPGLTVTPAEGDTTGFFKVVVDFKEIQ